MDNTRIIWTAIIGGILIIGFMAVFVDIILFPENSARILVPAPIKKLIPLKRSFCAY